LNRSWQLTIEQVMAVTYGTGHVSNLLNGSWVICSAVHGSYHFNMSWHLLVEQLMVDTVEQVVAVSCRAAHGNCLLKWPWQLLVEQLMASKC